MKNKKGILPYKYTSVLKEKFAPTNILYNSMHKEVILLEVDSSKLTYDNFRFLAELFKTTKVNTGTYIAERGGCPTCGDADEYVEVNFTISDAVISYEE